MGDTIPSDDTPVIRTTEALKRGNDQMARGLRALAARVEIAAAQARGSDALARLMVRQAQEIDDLRAIADRLKDERDNAVERADSRLVQAEFEASSRLERINELDALVADLTAERDAAAANARNERAYSDRIRKRYHQLVPRTGVVTSPRFYSDEQEGEAFSAVLRAQAARRPAIEIVWDVAAALGMRRAAK